MFAITPIYAIATAVLLLVLGALVSIKRAKTGISILHGDDMTLAEAMRHHGNLAENSGIFIAVLALLEVSGMASTAVYWFAVLFAVARISHAVGFMHQDGSHANLEGNKFFLATRVIGATLTGWIGLALGGYFGYFHLA